MKKPEALRLSGCALNLPCLQACANLSEKLPLVRHACQTVMASIYGIIVRPQAVQNVRQTGFCVLQVSP